MFQVQDRLTFHNIGVVGTGAMGRGIAQIAAQAGCTVHLFDAQPAAVEAACAALRDTWD
ncbi:MAG: 3-hydroxyacyl-CoA dehydrogenase NAD-binding domain-containing protein, partial [Tepidimonas sp.]|nr:3-hydroxyacyl-CoA dehydrogenase NAD-binding domain-containing protein [Tepidimonas sp.]